LSNERRVSGSDLPSESTLEILDRAQRGDRAAIQTLIERATPAVRRWARGRLPPYVRQEANTEDVVQDAVLRTLKNLTRLRHRTVGGLQAYLRTGVINRIRDLIRGVGRHGIPVEVSDTLRDDTPSPLEIAIKRQQLTAFLEALGRLKPADRQLIIWRVELSYTADEIATRLGKSKAAAGMSVSRALARLAKELHVSADE
jgi:RNA polymerase sigma factor (sigma-70 family)